MYPGQQNYPGWLWTATTSSLTGYESLLERDRLWLADFDPRVRWIVSQPFWIRPVTKARVCGPSSRTSDVAESLGGK